MYWYAFTQIHMQYTYLQWQDGNPTGAQSESEFDYLKYMHVANIYIAKKTQNVQ